MLFFLVRVYRFERIMFVLGKRTDPVSSYNILNSYRKQRIYRDLPNGETNLMYATDADILRIHVCLK